MERMKNKIPTCLCIVLYIIILSYSTFAISPPTVEWNKTYGGGGFDDGNSVYQTSDDGYIIVGNTRSYGAGNSDVFLVKTDNSGNLEWNKTYGGVGSERGNSVQQTTDNGYIMTGDGDSFGNGSNVVYLIKTDINGNIQWLKTFGDSKNNRGHEVQQTIDGGYIITGYNWSEDFYVTDVFLIKTDSNGTKEWIKSFDGSDFDTAFSVKQTQDGGYVIVGSTETLLHSDFWLIKTDSLGNMEWDRTYGGNSSEYGNAVQQTSDNGYIVTGYTYSFGLYRDYYLVKTDSDGNMEWNKTFGGAAKDDAWSVKETLDNGYLVLGFTQSFGAGDLDVWLVRTDSAGNIQWNKTYGETGRDYADLAQSLQKTSDGGYVIAGGTSSYGSGSSDVWLIKLAPECLDSCCPQDLNNDNSVDWLDVGVFSGCYGSNTTINLSCEPSDFDSNGIVDWLDIGPFSACYGESW